ncbi:YceI family protein [Ruficoccus amylovorans]|uniref:YceI family protein n=1 Tax=Ruficoccus amylovorans TaxID=1804625 RepID=A0A842HDB6_9BACT|nr:YceI family protein [Ruficoccus amylovorans]MBC2594048.1 YceI family protein [Ruficoccus amylovorans]
MTQKTILSLLALGIGSLVAVPAQAANTIFQIDPNHSEVSFKVRHFLNQVPGKFTEFTGEISVNDADMTKSTVNATIQAKSIDTSNTKRDDHLESADYFDIAKYATITFQSTKWVQTGADTYDVTGDLTMLGVTKPVVLKVKYLGQQEGVGHYQGLLINGWEATTEIKRSDWGLTAGGPVVGDDVSISLSIQGHHNIVDSKGPNPTK